MKNKKYFYGLLVLVLLLCAGIGFAAVTSTLTINGTASTATDSELANNLKVNFTDKKDYAAANGEKHAATAIIDNVITGTITATGFSAIGQTAKVVFEISNSSEEFNVTVGASIVYGKGKIGTKDANFNDYFSVKQYFVSANDIDAAYLLTSGNATIDINSNAKAYIVFEVSLIKLPTSQLKNASFTVNLTATAK